MIRRTISTLIAAIALVSGVTWAQAPQQSGVDSREAAREKLIQQAADPATLAILESMRATVEKTEAAKRQRDGATCSAPGDQQVPLNAVGVFDGRTYRCVEIFVPTVSGGLTRSGVGLIRGVTDPAPAQN